MPLRDYSELARALPRLRHDLEASRRLAARAVARAKDLTNHAVATRQVLESRLRAPRASSTPSEEIWNAAARELVRASRERDRELGIVAHELRQTLSAALAADRLLAVSTDSQAVDRAHVVLSRQLLHLSELIDSLLEYSQLSLNVASLKQRQVELVQVVSGAVETVSALAAERDHRVDVHYVERPLVVCGDAVRLRQALINLLQNAVRYTPNGGRIDVTVSRRDAQACIEVRDTGEGIDRDGLEAIFGSFVRMSAEGSGLGIGLALVKRIVELHGGTVTARSDGRGRGSTFTVSLPVGKDSDGRP
jgi:signal transduction histidine kinase